MKDRAFLQKKYLISYSAIYVKLFFSKNLLPLFCSCMIDAICSKSSEPNSSHFSSREDHKVDVAAASKVDLSAHPAQKEARSKDT